MWRRAVVACEVMRPELESVSKDGDGVSLHYLDQGLHRIPQTMPQRVQQQIDEIEDSITSIVLGYGLCSNGIVGVTSSRHRLIVPRCHDCIAFFLGSPSAYKKAFSERPGTYYLTAGWLEQRKDPLSMIEDDYSPRYGWDTSVWVMEQELKHYTHIALIDTGARTIDGLRERAVENARFLRKEFIEIQGGLDFFRKILQGPYAEKDFFILGPNESISQDMFLDR